MFADANMASPVDGRILKNFGKEDLDEDSIKQYRRRFEQWNPDHVWNALPEDEFLEKLNVFRKDRQTSEYGLTLAGLLMFGSYSAIVDANPNFFPDYQEISEKSDRWVNRICPDGNWASNLFQFYSRVLPILQNFLPKPFKLEDNQRKTETPAHVAVREALANALVHADYTENASLNIYKYPNKMVFSNPGTMLISLRQYYHGGESVCRNKYLQTMFTFLGSTEKAGSGADKIIKGWEDQNWKKPYIVENSRPNKVVLTMTMESLVDDYTIEALKNLLGEKVNNLSHNQLVTLALAYSEEEVSNERLRYALDIHRADISDMLSKMCEDKLLESTGYGRGTKYHVYNSKVALPDSNVALPDSNVALPDPNVALPDPNVALPRKRYSKSEMESLVLSVCQDWKTAEEIASSVGRNVAYIKNTVLPNLANVIEKMYDIPHHPKQRYRAKRMSVMNTLFTIKTITDTDTGFTAVLRCTPEHLIYQAHFPGNPITPGACLLQTASEVLQRKMGRPLYLKASKNVKYLNVLVPAEDKEVRFMFSNLAQSETECKVQVVITDEAQVYTKMSLTFSYEPV